MDRDNLLKRIVTYMTTPQEIKKPEPKTETPSGARGSLRIGVALLIAIATYHQIVKHSEETSNPLVPGVSFSRVTTVLANSILR